MLREEEEEEVFATEMKPGRRHVTSNNEQSTVSACASTSPVANDSRGSLTSVNNLGLLEQMRHIVDPDRKILSSSHPYPSKNELKENFPQETKALSKSSSAVSFHLDSDLDQKHEEELDDEEMSHPQIDLRDEIWRHPRPRFFRRTQSALLLQKKERVPVLPGTHARNVRADTLDAFLSACMRPPNKLMCGSDDCTSVTAEESSLSWHSSSFHDEEGSSSRIQDEHADLSH